MSLSRPEYLLIACLVLPELLLAKARLPGYRASLGFLVGPRLRVPTLRRFSRYNALASLSAALFVVSVAFGLSGPSWGKRAAAVERSGLEVSVVLDVSRSMESLDQAPSRLEASKALIRGLIRGRGGPGVDALRPDGIPSFALTVFKGEALSLVPMTEDGESLDSALDYADPETMTARGTNLEKGLREGLAAFTKAGSGNRILLLFTDGGELLGSGRRVVEDLRRQRVRLIVVGQGGKAAVPVPGPGGGSVLDSSGRPVRTTLNVAKLGALASEAGGRWLEGAGGSVASALAAEIAAARSGGTRIEYQSVDRTGFFAALSLLFLIGLLICEILAFRGKRP